jgi:hypothetical protein
VDLVKLDVEGFELEVLRGLQATLAEQQPLIVMEYGPVTRDKAGGGSKLRDLLPGYRLFGHAFTRVARLRLKPLGFHLTAFDPERTWDHAVCVPQRYLDVVPGTGV